MFYGKVDYGEMFLALRYRVTEIKRTSNLK